ncbi:hypothetical protein E0H75_18585 [Kribbella capetownensis]|uniref:Uncharacterized protein n=1 Tax=Kribbella capetownensis TaxID=1572659 RepID=A0A4R0JTY5_9ACTN|nr:hypothetical protein [Kribbella capetownensis]TCC48598.1 hypothetical protein E0H75_18585 [Kribbella capetownensis]
MNLLTPPPVEKLDAEYADQVRRDLVRKARKRQRPAWVPVVAAACGMAVITTAVVLLSRPGDDSGAPAANTSAPTATPTVVQVPPAKSARVSLDLGQATASEARAAARNCLADLSPREGGNAPAKPQDADSATVRQARWIKTMAGSGVAKILMQTFTTAKGYWFQCLGDDLVRSRPSADSRGGLNVADPVLGDWRLQQGTEAGGPLLLAEYSFVTLPSVVRMELRIRWTAGASPWYGVTFSDGAGYIAASQLGAVAKRGEMEVDVRAFDTTGKQVFSDVEYG